MAIEILTNPATIVVMWVLPLVLPFVISNLNPKRRHPRYAIRRQHTIDVPSSEVSKITIKVEGASERVSQIGISRMAFWNAGNLDIEKKHVNTPISLSVKSDHRILAAGVVRKSRPQMKCNTTVTQDSKTLTLSFDILKSKDGVIVEIIHDGMPDDDFVFNGDVADATVERRPYIPSKSRRGAEYLAIWFALIWWWGMGLFLLAIGEFFGLILPVAFTLIICVAKRSEYPFMLSFPAQLELSGDDATADK